MPYPVGACLAGEWDDPNWTEPALIRRRDVMRTRTLTLTLTLILSWITAGLLLPTMTFADQLAELEAGKKQFGFRCAACHSLSADAPPMFGPHLENIVGRTGGTVEGFEYTDPKLLANGVVWDEEYFEDWLQHPQREYPQMCLAFQGLANAEARRALFLFLENPVP